MSRVIGVDASKMGWVGITSDLRGYFGATIDQLVAAADSDGTLDVVAIDIPTPGLRTATGTRPGVVTESGSCERRFMDDEQRWLGQFVKAAEDAGIKFREGWPAGEPLPDPKALVHAMCAAYDAAVDVGRMIDAL